MIKSLNIGEQFIKDLRYCKLMLKAVVYSARLNPVSSKVKIETFTLFSGKTAFYGWTFLWFQIALEELGGQSSVYWYLTFLLLPLAPKNDEFFSGVFRSKLEIHPDLLVIN